MAETVEAPGAPGAGETQTGVASEGGNISLDELSGSFAAAMRKAEEPEAEPEGEQVSDEGEGEEQVEQPDAEPETEEDSEPGHDEDDDVLRELQPHAAKKARKRIDKLTARAKEAEEKLQDADSRFQQLQERLQKLESGERQEQSQPATFTDRVKSVDSAEELQQLYETARQARKWARENLHEDSVEVNGQILDRHQITRILNEAEEAIETAIPSRFQYIQTRKQVEQNAIRDFPAWKDEKHPDHGKLKAVWEDKTAGQVLRTLPNGRYITGLIVEGLNAMEARRAAAEKGEAPKKKAAPIAPRVPSVGDSVASSPQSSQSQSIEDKFKGKVLTNDDLVAVFAEKERARSKQK
jgi:hypothetical protein